MGVIKTWNAERGSSAAEPVGAPEDGAPTDPRAHGLWPKVAVSTLALAALVFLVLLHAEVQVGLVALVALAILPWVSSVIEAVDLPGGGSVRFREVERRVERQEEKLRAQQEVIAQLVVFSVSWYIFDLLSKLYHRNREGGEYLFRENDDAMMRDLRFLRDHGYLEHFQIADLRDKQDLVGTLKLTPVGNFLVELREQLQTRPAIEAARALSERL